MFKGRRLPGPASRPDWDEGAVADGELDLGALGRALWRRKLRVVLLALLVAAAAFAAVDGIEPRYRSEARLLIEGRENVFVRPEAERGADRDRSAVDQEAVNSQVQLVLSREVARRVIEDLRLKERPEFDPALAPAGQVRRLLMLFGLARDPLRTRPEERLFDSYYQRLSAYQVDRSRVIAIEFTSVDPELAARAANAVALAYLDHAQGARLDQTRAASQWLLREIETLRARVAEAEQAVERFRARSNLFLGPNNNSLSNQQLGEVNTAVTQARAQKAEADAKAQAIRDMLRSGRPIETNDIINSELIRRLNEQRVTLRAQLAEQSSTLLDGHPRIKELRAQIADLEREIRSEAERLVRSLENDARIAAARVAELTRSLDQLKAQASSSSEQDVRLRALEREAKAQRDLLESYLAKYREASARETLGPDAADARIISRAIVSNTPYFPRKLPIVLIAFLATLVTGAAFVATGALLGAGRVRTVPAQRAPEEEDEPEPAGPMLDQRDPRDRHDFLAAAATDRMAAALRTRATPPRFGSYDYSFSAAVEVLRGDYGSRVAVVGLTADTSTGPAAAALADALAPRGNAIVVRLVADPERPEAAPGLAELLTRRATFSQVIHRGRGSRAHMMEAGYDAPDLAALVSTERFEVTTEALERAYPYLIFDAGPAPAVANAELARLAPVTVLVTPPELVAGAEAARQNLLEAGCREVVILAEPAEVEPVQAVAA